jgi:hypothetical protein
MQLEDALVAPNTATIALTDLVQVYQVAQHPQGAKVMTAGDLLQSVIGQLPTNASGLPVGALYLNSGVLTRVMA